METTVPMMQTTEAKLGILGAAFARLRLPICMEVQVAARHPGFSYAAQADRLAKMMGR